MYQMHKIRIYIKQVYFDISSIFLLSVLR